MNDTTFENCPYCCKDIEIPNNKPSKCSNCGNIILPCSTCPDYASGYKNCNWTKEKGCFIYPKPYNIKKEVKMRINKEIFEMMISLEDYCIKHAPSSEYNTRIYDILNKIEELNKKIIIGNKKRGG